jgi:[ribosomal protein S5]-alanine N-acetyltransferase
MEFFRERLEQGGKEAEGWYSWYAIRNADEQSTGVLVGAAGYFGPPDASGTVEIGYSVLPEWQRRGYARAMIQALVKNAFAFDDVERVIAHTAEENHASIAVLLRCGFGAVGQGHEPGMLRFERKHGASAVKRGKEGYDD